MHKDSSPELQDAFPLTLPPGGDRRGRRIAVVLAIGCVATIILASFYPFQPIRHNPALLHHQWMRFIHPFAAFHTLRLLPRLGHMLENVLFYFPLGAAVALALPHDPRGFAASSRVRPSRSLRGVVFSLGFVMSLTIEFLQIGFRGREPDLLDTAMNTLGYLVGLGGVNWLARGWRLGEGERRAMARLLCLAYGAALVMAAVLPLDALAELRQQLSNLGSVAPSPSGFVGLWAPWPAGRIAWAALVCLVFFPLGFLARLAQGAWDGRRRLAVLLVVLIMAAALMLGRSTFDLARVLAAGIGALAGAEWAGLQAKRYAIDRPL